MKANNAAYRAGCIRAEWMMVFATVVMLAANSARGGIVNGGFEDGLNGWTVTGGFTAVTGPHLPTEGTHYATADFTQSQPGSASMSQTFTVPAQATWLYVDLVAQYTGPTGQIESDLILPGNQHVILWQLPGGVFVPPENNFKRYHYDLSGYQGQVVTLSFAASAMPFEGFTSSAYVHVDRIVIVPEPATIALLGMGLMVMMPRRSSRR
ncbi:MAG: PEP-CTERM sorting domain-containing protein [Phycisphaerales bacterium]